MAQYTTLWLANTSGCPWRLPVFQPLKNCTLVFGHLKKICIFGLFSTAYNKCALHDAHAGHTRAGSRHCGEPWYGSKFGATNNGNANQR